MSYGLGRRGDCALAIRNVCSTRGVDAVIIADRTDCYIEKNVTQFFRHTSNETDNISHEGRGFR